MRRNEIHFIMDWGRKSIKHLLLLLLLLLLTLALQPTVGFGLSNNVLPFFPIYHHLAPSSHSQHLKISFYLLFPPFPGSSPSSRPFQFLSEELFGYHCVIKFLVFAPSSIFYVLHENEDIRRVKSIKLKIRPAEFLCCC